nr:transketolase [Candidatus Cloacimonadota bacterium]
MKHDPQNPTWPERDRMVVSIGHISPCVYSCLGLQGYFPLEDAIIQYRQYGGLFEGHIERQVPGVEWSTGNLGQGLSAAVGFAMASRINGIDNHTYVLMGDGEQQKGQLSEARRFAAKFKLANLTAIVDYNQLQISGSIHDVMPQRIRQNWESDGWQVMEVNGHDISQILDTLDEAKRDPRPVMILAHTVMGKGVSFMENKAQYHGTPLSEELLKQALQELDLPDELEKYRQLRNEFQPSELSQVDSFHPHYDLAPGKPLLYTSESDCRSAWGKALADLGNLNKDKKNPIVVVDCDLSSSVKTNEFAQILPERFLESGIMEHHAAVMSGAISTTGIQCFWSDFGVFGIDEVYNMQRLNDINHTNLKTVVTHVGMDVGGDGKTHQCIDYISLVRNLFDSRIICPADANHTDRIIRWLINKPGNYFIAMGRSKLPIIKDQDGEIFYDLEYCYEYGKSDILRPGDQGTVFVTGTPVGRALKAVDALREEGIFVELVYISSPLFIDFSLIQNAIKRGLIFTIEDHSIHGGLGTTIAEAIVEAEQKVKLVKIGVPDYSVSGDPVDLFKAAGMDTASLIKRIKEEL